MNPAVLPNSKILARPPLQENFLRGLKKVFETHPLHREIVAQSILLLGARRFEAMFHIQFQGVVDGNIPEVEEADGNLPEVRGHPPKVRETSPQGGGNISPK